MGDLVYIHRSKEKWIDIKEEPLPNEECWLLLARGTADAPIMEL